MLYRSMILVLSVAIGVTISGCAGTSPVMRGQNPQAQFSGWQQSGDGGNAGSCPDCRSGSCPSGFCLPGYDSGTVINLPGDPVHRNSFTYNVPQGLRYPPSPTPAAITQYPYYTFRGPTDFFMP